MTHAGHFTRRRWLAAGALFAGLALGSYALAQAIRYSHEPTKITVEAAPIAAFDPRDESKTYHSNSFEVLRIQNGKVQEHWDSARKNPNSGAIKTGVSPKPPMDWNTGKISKEEQHNLELATMELKDMLQYGHLELADKVMDPGYIQHNPQVPQGRDGFKQFMSRIPGRRPEDAKPIKPEWINPPVLTLVNGPYVLFMWDRKSKDPDDASREYTWNHFDVVRVENGLIKEHWDEAVLTAPQAGGKKQ